MLLGVELWDAGLSLALGHLLCVAQSVQQHSNNNLLQFVRNCFDKGAAIPTLTARLLEVDSNMVAM